MNSETISRREFLRWAAGAAAFISMSSLGPAAQAKDEAGSAPVRAITRGPKFHWFGYYDKLQFDPTGRYVLGMEVDFEHRSPRPDDVIRVGMIDLQDNDRWIELGTSRAWNWQQGCMLQWLPGTRREVIWNDREDDQFVCHDPGRADGQKRARCRIRSTRSVPMAAGRCRRTSAGSTTPGRATATPGSRIRTAASPPPRTPASGRWTCRPARQRLLLSLARGGADSACPAGSPPAPSTGSTTCCSHRRLALHLPAPLAGPSGGQELRRRACSPPARDGKDLHRARSPAARPRTSSGAIRSTSWPGPGTSRGEQRRSSSTRTGPSEVEVIGDDVMTENGHCTYLPGNRWILNDTYPDKDRNQHLYLFDICHGHRRIPLGRFHVAAGVRGRVALRHAPALQPGWPQCRHRLAARRQRPADVPDRHRGPCQDVKDVD